MERESCVPLGSAMSSREMTTLTLIYARRPAERMVLLGMKKRGFGSGKLNGFGGKLEVGESVEASVVRELEEESGLRTSQDDLRWCGTLKYIYDTKPKGMEVHIYELERWDGEPVETEEMKPAWFKHEDIPLQDMWADDEFWLTQYLDGELRTPFTGRFRFKGHEGADSWVVLERHVAPIAVPCRSRLSFNGGDVDVGACAGERSGAAMIVTTVSFSRAPKGNARPLESFLRYHLQKGFVLILVVIDDPSDAPAIGAVRKFPCNRVVVRVRDEALFDEQRRLCASFEKLSPLCKEEVSARQMLDAELAMALAPAMGCSWVMCLDSDELFFTKEASIVPHFEALANDGVDQMTYLNHEGVPEFEDTVDYFATTTLFKRHHFAVPLTAEARAGMHFWRSRSRREQYLLFYDNGKSACRAGLGARPRSQHVWQLPPGKRSKTALADPRQLRLEDFQQCDDPCVLHIPVCGLEWLAAKYSTLGVFADAWLGGSVKLPASFHTDARDACVAGATDLEALFRQEVLLTDKGEAARQVASEVCLRIVAHAQLLEAVVAPEGEAPAVPVVTATSVAPIPLGGSPQGTELGWILSKTVGYL
eukprot:TRINITY_DN68373_c0_g1_i1.p1 TRINITY_DN68373_c0_g1~~TRINITY_DN68373_c0_g1_i1.p1  ORF type:complete len:592 (+),score=96.88 TRINITY_DN68373_c0_g1_i1:134-1909(+)